MGKKLFYTVLALATLFLTCLPNDASAQKGIRFKKTPKRGTTRPQVPGLPPRTIYIATEAKKGAVKVHDAALAASTRVLQHTELKFSPVRVQKGRKKFLEQKDNNEKLSEQKQKAMFETHRQQRLKEIFDKHIHFSVADMRARLTRLLLQWAIKEAQDMQHMPLRLKVGEYEYMRDFGHHITNPNNNLTSTPYGEILILDLAA